MAHMQGFFKYLPARHRSKRCVYDYLTVKLDMWQHKLIVIKNRYAYI